MNRIERVERALDGREPDRPPLSLWYHFGLQYGGGERFARISLEFFRHYGFDFLKVMNDHFHPLPAGVESVRTRADMERIARINPAEAGWPEQFRALEIIARELRGEALFIDTVFDPWQTLRRGMAAESLDTLMDEEPEALLGALEVIAENLSDYCRRSIAIGSSGIFLSIAAGAEIVSRERFRRFVKPFAERVLSAVRGRARMNVAHIHGEELHFDDCLDLPADVFNWWDRGPKGPPLSLVKERTGACVMGGIDHRIVSRASRPFLREHVRQGIELGGRTRFLLAGGCSIDAWADPAALRTIVEAASA